MNGAPAENLSNSGFFGVPDQITKPKVGEKVRTFIGQVYQTKTWADPASAPIDIEINLFHRLRQSPFDILDERKPNSEQVVQLICEIDTSSINNKERLIDRLNYLNEVRLEEEPEDAPMDAASLRNFVGFLYSETDLKYPDIVLTPKGFIRCEWHVSSSRRCVMEFLPNGKASFLIVDYHQEENARRLSGFEPAGRLMSVLKALNYHDWLRD